MDVKESQFHARTRKDEKYAHDSYSTLFSVPEVQEEMRLSKSAITEEAVHYGVYYEDQTSYICSIFDPLAKILKLSLLKLKIQLSLRMKWLDPPKKKEWPSNGPDHVIAAFEAVEDPAYIEEGRNGRFLSPNSSDDFSKDPKKYTSKSINEGCTPD
jgi:hypothetical protein